MEGSSPAPRGLFFNVAREHRENSDEDEKPR